MTDPASRHALFLAAQQSADLSLRQLWLRYVALAGSCGLIEIDAFLHGLSGLAGAQQDILAHTLNERLDEVYRSKRVPYLINDLTALGSEDPLAVLDQLLDRPPQAPGPHPPD